MTVVLLVVSVAAALIAVLCWRISRLHWAVAALCRCIALMLDHPDRAHEVAKASRDDLIARGLWSSK